MALEDSVNTLVNSTTALLTAVNVSKATLDASTASAAGSAVTTTANAAAASASASAASASASAASSSATNAAASAASASAIVLGVSSGLPSIKPTLNLDFANSQTVDPRITFTRTGTAAYYDGKTTVKAEENLLTYSQEFDNAAWVKDDITLTANTTTAPDGTSTADTAADTALNSDHRVITSASLSFTAGLAYTLSAYVKNVDKNYVQLALGSASFGATGYANFDVSTGVLGTAGAGTTASITPIGSGWYRCSITATASSTSTSQLFIGLVSSATAVRSELYVGTGQSVYIWGAQLEQRSTVTAYTPTTTQAITNYIPAIQYAPANTPRIDFDPITGECKGLLIEEQRTNLLTYSEQFDNAAWSKSNAAVTANTVIAPDGTLTADKLAEDTISAQHAARQDFITAGQAIVFSVCAKAAERTQLNLRNGNLGVSSVFNLTAGTIVSTGAGQTAAIVPLGNNWYRCSISFTSTVGTQQFLLGTAQSGNVFYTGDGYSGIYIWGAQLEAGAFPTSYIPTVASQVTRGADSASMTGVNFSSWYRADEGTVYAENIVAHTTSANWVAAITDGTLNNVIDLTPALVLGAIKARARVIQNGAEQSSLQGSTVYSASQSMKLVNSYKVNNFAESDAGLLNTDALGTVPTGLSALYIGQINTFNYTPGHIKRISYYPKRLSNSELQSLTA